MAGEWIKVDISLPTKPEVIRIGRIIGLSPYAVCGYLIRFWGWASTSTCDGNVTQLALQDVDMIVTLPGFAEALVAVGWLNFDEKNGLKIPNFERHNGESAKKRALTKDRMKRYRDANVTQTASPEKRREDSKPIVVQRQPKGSRLDPDIQLSEDWKNFCLQERPGLDPIGVFSSFVDYWIAKPGSAGVKLDWAATWRNWVRNQRESIPTKKNGIDWWSSESSIIAKGIEIGLSPRPGESTNEFKGRINARLGAQ